MGKFVNRDEELALIERAITTLGERRRLLTTPIIEFYGIDGLGKTSLLREIQETYNKRLHCKWEDKNTAYQSVRKPEALLQAKEPIVVLLDGLEAADEDQLPEIEAGLHNLTENSNLFIVVASRKAEKFENTRPLARKLTLVPLKPFNRKSCESYFDSKEHALNSKIRDFIYEWTRGYPLAMDVVIEAISTNNLDPSKERDQRQIVSVLTRRIIDQHILSSYSIDRSFDETILSLLSVPRRFNLIIMQDIIENFAPPDYKLINNLAYIALPDRVNQVTNANVLTWSMRQGGYRIEAPVRNLFLLKFKIQRPQDYIAMNRYLAQLNERFAREVSGSDRVRYLREYFYHLANSSNAASLPPILTEHIEQLIQSDSFDVFLQFYEEFIQDEELQEALGVNSSIVLSLLHRRLAQTHRELAEGSSEFERIDHLRKFLFHAAHDPEVKDLSQAFEQVMQQIQRKVSSEVYSKLLHDLSQDEKLKKLLTKDYDTLLQ